MLVIRIVDCSLHNRHIALKDDYHKEKIRKDMLASTHVRSV